MTVRWVGLAFWKSVIMLHTLWISKINPEIFRLIWEFFYIFHQILGCFSILWAVSNYKLLTYPGRWISSGENVPVSTISSTSAIAKSLKLTHKIHFQSILWFGFHNFSPKILVKNHIIFPMAIWNTAKSTHRAMKWPLDHWFFIIFRAFVV